MEGSKGRAAELSRTASFVRRRSRRKIRDGAVFAERWEKRMMTANLRKHRTKKKTGRDEYGRSIGNIPTEQVARRNNSKTSSYIRSTPDIRHAWTATTWPGGGCFLDGTRRLGRIIIIIVDDDSTFDMIPNLWREESGGATTGRERCSSFAAESRRDETRRQKPCIFRPRLFQGLIVRSRS